MLLDNKTKSNENGYFKVFDLLADYVETGRVDIVTGYFSASAIAKLSDKVDNAKSFRMILGDLLQADAKDDKIKTYRINNKYLTSLLNSKIIEFWLLYKGKLQGNLYQIDKYPLLHIPIFKTDEKNRSSIIFLFDRILAEKKSNPIADTTPLEAEIDARVSHLYNLTEDEYALILKEINCPDPFRVAALNIYRDIARGK